MDEKEEKPEVGGDGLAVRPNCLMGETFMYQTECGKLYVTVNVLNRKPFEVFVLIGKGGGCAGAQSEGIARLVSLALRSGVKVKAIVKHLRGITCHSRATQRAQMEEGVIAEDFVLSCPDAVGRALAKFVEKEE